MRDCYPMGMTMTDQTRPLVTFAAMEGGDDNAMPFGVLFSEKVASSSLEITRYKTKTQHGGEDVPNDESDDTDN
jgi:hypothetical protein